MGNKSAQLARYTPRIPKKKEKMVAKEIIIMSAVETPLRGTKFKKVFYDEISSSPRKGGEDQGGGAQSHA
jgi:hypothetical protein